MFCILAALSGILGQFALGVYYSGALVPRALILGNVTSAQLTGAVAPVYHSIILDAWLQCAGALLSVVFFIALVSLSGAQSRFAGLMTIIGSTVLLATALGDATFAIGGANAALIGHAGTAQVALDLVAGPGEAFDYAFLFVSAPLVILSLGSVLLSSQVLPRPLGWLALALGVAFVGVGLASIATPLAGSLGTVFEVVQLFQVAWVVATAVSLMTRSGRVERVAESGGS